MRTMFTLTWLNCWQTCGSDTWRCSQPVYSNVQITFSGTDAVPIQTSSPPHTLLVSEAANLSDWLGQGCQIQFHHGLDQQYVCPQRASCMWGALRTEFRGALCTECRVLGCVVYKVQSLVLCPLHNGHPNGVLPCSGCKTECESHMTRPGGPISARGPCVWHVWTSSMEERGWKQASPITTWSRTSPKRGSSLFCIPPPLKVGSFWDGVGGEAGTWL